MQKAESRELTATGSGKRSPHRNVAVDVFAQNQKGLQLPLISLLRAWSGPLGNFPKGSQAPEEDRVQPPGGFHCRSGTCCWWEHSRGWYPMPGPGQEETRRKLGEVSELLDGDYWFQKAGLPTSQLPALAVCGWLRLENGLPEPHRG